MRRMCDGAGPLARTVDHHSFVHGNHRVHHQLVGRPDAFFAPINFHGIKVPGLKLLFPFLPRRVQVIPAITSDGRFGWQGIVPSRAEKMASIAVDKSLAKVGSIADFYRVLDPDSIAEHLVNISRSEVRGVVTRIMTAENPQLWHNLPTSVKEAVFRKVEDDLPASVRMITDRIEEDIDEFIDAKLMVIRYLSSHPKLLNDIFRTMGNKELRFMQNFGFYFGFPMGFVLVGISIWFRSGGCFPSAV